MTNILLVPIRVDALQADGQMTLVAPVADFTGLPYRYYDDNSSGGGNSNQPGPPPPPSNGPPTPPNGGPTPPPNPGPGPTPPPDPNGQANVSNAFLGSTVVQPPAFSTEGDGQWTPPSGLHLHWKLPAALATQREDPHSGGVPRFPKAPNRWLVVASTQTDGAWQPAATWVIESDYLHATPNGDPSAVPPGTISFPIAPPDELHKILNADPQPPKDDPAPQDIAAYPFYYQAPFRHMGRKVEIGSWQTDANLHEYLPQYNPAGLTAAGYGHPLFAAVYPNCASVFGCHDAVQDGVYPRRYEVIGWYDAAAADCMQLFQNLENQPDPWKALSSEYRWTVGDNSEELPALSVYYARLDIAQALSGDLPSPEVSVAVGNTTGEALSAYLASNLAAASSAPQELFEEQIEAFGMQTQMQGEHVDLAATFEEARHDKSFKKIHGGSLWSVRVRHTTGKASTPTQEVTLPGELAHLLNTANLAQQTYDNAWNQIESLRQRAYADWYRLAAQFGAPPVPPAPTLDDIVDYSDASALAPLQQLAAATGTIEFGTGPSGAVSITVGSAGIGPDVPVQFTAAQALAQALEVLSSSLQAYNAGTAAVKANMQYYLVRKGAPRFYQPTEPAVLLQGPAVDSTQHTSANSTVACVVVPGLSFDSATHPLTDDLRTNGMSSSGAFGMILAQIETLSASGGPGFSTQSTQPWSPVVLNWQTSVWPETDAGTVNPTDSEVAYNPGYINNRYELDVDAADLKIKVRPSQLAAQEPAETYTGRAILTAHAPAKLQQSIAAYLLGLTLHDLKQWGCRGAAFNAEVDYHYDRHLFAWASQYFGMPTYSGACIDPATSPTAQVLAEQQNEIRVWMSQQYPFRMAGKQEPTLIDLTALAATTWCGDTPVLDDNGALTTLATLSSAEQAENPVATAMSAWGKIAGGGLLAQALSGFNDALLTRQRDLQLPVWDYRVMDDQNQCNYARDLSCSLGSVRTAPLDGATFLPIRSGLMQFVDNCLALVDSFGQLLPLTFTTTDTIKSARMTLLDNVASSVTAPSAIADADENADYIYLPPRLAQESRLNFRWLAADQGNVSGNGDEIEMNDHPATTPVCGWVLPNNLDGSLMVYATDGAPLGSLLQADGNVVWESAPGINNSVLIQTIPNPHLRDFVANLAIWGEMQADNWGDFLSGVNQALQNIDPKSFAEHEALALLIGRPLAVVRATLGMQVMGLPAVDNSPAAFTYDLDNGLIALSASHDAVAENYRFDAVLDFGVQAQRLPDTGAGIISAPSHRYAERRCRPLPGERLRPA